MPGSLRLRRIRSTHAIAIYGAGGLGRELLEVVHEMGTTCAGFIVDPQYPAPDRVRDIKVYRSAAPLAADPSVRFVVALGSSAARARVAAELELGFGAQFATIVHPRAWIADTAGVGQGSMIFGFTSVTANVNIGRHVLVNPGTTIAHDCDLSDFVTIGPSCALAGGVTIEEGAELGVGVRVAPRVRIGRAAVVGAGAVCIRPVAAGETVAGVPARPLVSPGGTP